MSGEKDPLVAEAGFHQNETRSRLRIGWVLAWVGVILLLGILFLGLYQSQKGQMKVGERAPDFALITFDGVEYKSSDLTGKVVLLNIWASWCMPCEQEAKYLEEAWRYYRPQGDVVFLGVAWTDTDKKSLEYLKRFDITYPNGPDLGTRIFTSFRATGVPETYIIDRKGIVTNVILRPFMSLNEIRTAIDQVLEK